MSFDWVTVVAQIVNFLILILLLKRFLYRPILAGIDAREADIAARVAAADAARGQAEADAAAHRAALADFETEKAGLVEAARQQAEAEKVRLRAKIDEMQQTEVDALRAQAEGQRVRLAADLRADGAGAIVSLTRRALRDLADADLEERIAGRLATRLAHSGAELRDAAAQAPRARVISSFHLPDDCRARVAAALHAEVADIPVDFQTEASASPGVVLRVGGAQIGWTIDAYLDAFETALDTHASRAGAERAVTT